MATVYSIAGYDGFILKTSTSSWAGARDTADGQNTGRTTARAAFGIEAARGAARGGGYQWIVFRSFLWFDTSGISEAPPSATLRVYGFSQATADIFAVQSNHSSDFVVGDYDAIEGWSSGADNEGNVTKLSSEITSWSTSGYNDITLNSTALSDMSSLDNFEVCLIESTHDLRNVAPTGAPRIGMYFADETGTSKDPYISYTEGEEEEAVTHNSVFFGTNF